MQAAATPADRDKIQKELTDLMAKNGMTGGRGGDGQGRGGNGPGGDGQGGGGRGRRGGGPGGPAGEPLEAVIARAGRVPVAGFTEEDRKNAKPPLPPQQDSQVGVLLRPGLLADVEIEIEKLPDVLHVPAQAVFTKEGKYTVFVQDAKGKFSPREIKLVKQSESMMVVASGIQPGETIAMADPTVKKSDKKGEKKGSGGNPMGGMPGGK
jgi:hypothetical protein